jgi:hypothetical protein
MRKGRLFIGAAVLGPVAWRYGRPRIQRSLARRGDAATERTPAGLPKNRHVPWSGTPESFFRSDSPATPGSGVPADSPAHDRSPR